MFVESSEEQAKSFMNRNVEKEPYPGVGEASLSIEVTTHCNSACLHCFARAGISKHSSLSLDLAKEIIAEGYKTTYRHLHITGGEPLLWEGLFEALDYAFDLGYETVFLNTNGTLLTKDVNSRFAACNGLSISVSLDGPETLHERLRGQGSYRRASQGIEKSLDAGIGVFVFAIVTKSLLADLPNFADEVYNKFPGIECLTLIPLIRVEDDFFALSKELLDPEDFLQLVRSVSLLNLYGLKTNVLNDPLVNVVSKLLEMPWIPEAHPLYREGSMIILANRNISLSHSTWHNLGKYEPGMIQKKLASDEYRKAVAPDETNCPSCKYVELCMKNGMVRPSESHMDMHPEALYCKRVLDRIVP